MRPAVDPVGTKRSSGIEPDRADPAPWTATFVRLVDCATVALDRLRREPGNEAREKSVRLEATAVI